MQNAVHLLQDQWFIAPVATFAKNEAKNTLSADSEKEDQR